MTPAGLCAGCAHKQEIRSPKGAVYLLCRLGLTDDNYPKYPRLPVLACRGYLPAPD